MRMKEDEHTQKGKVRVGIHGLKEEPRDSPEGKVVYDVLGLSYDLLRVIPIKWVGK